MVLLNSCRNRPIIFVKKCQNDVKVWTGPMNVDEQVLGCFLFSADFDDETLRVVWCVSGPLWYTTRFSVNYWSPAPIRESTLQATDVFHLISSFSLRKKGASVWLKSTDTSLVRSLIKYLAPTDSESRHRWSGDNSINKNVN